LAPAGTIVELPRSELTALQALLRAHQLPDDDCAESALYFCAIFDGDILAAAGGLEPAGACALLRSVVVRAEYRCRGLAEHITRHLIARARAESRAEVYLLTETAEKYFVKLGFQLVERSEVPVEVAGTRQFSTLCPQSASCMRLELSSRRMPAL